VSTQPLAIQNDQISINESSPNWPARYARFGSFLIDTQREELYREGQRVRVQAKIFKALSVLVVRPGEIVTREEVRQRVWAEAPLSSIDANVNTAMNKLRQLLGDSSEKPTYIETIPRRGYCFIAPVQFSEARELATVQRREIAADAERIPWASRIFGSVRGIANPLPLIGLVIAAIVLGALLMLAWSFVLTRNQQVSAPAEKEIVTRACSESGVTRISECASLFS
jgi:DNA-binding winged helix-turn-helix (wHTH) protein